MKHRRISVGQLVEGFYSRFSFQLIPVPGKGYFDKSRFEREFKMNIIDAYDQ